jgi:hypothetical protein
MSDTNIPFIETQYSRKTLLMRNILLTFFFVFHSAFYASLPNQFMTTTIALKVHALACLVLSLYVFAYLSRICRPISAKYILRTFGNIRLVKSISVQAPHRRRYFNRQVPAEET